MASFSVERKGSLVNVEGFSDLSFNTIRSLLVSPKDTSKKEKQCGLIYSVKCSECDHEYISETARLLGIKFWEHSDGKHPNSAIKEHSSSTHHHYTLDDTKILVKEDKWFPRKIWEALHIHKRSPALNLDNEIRAILLQHLSCDPEVIWPATLPSKKSMRHEHNIWYIST